MLFWAEILAVFLYVTPLALTLAARSRRDRAPWEYALDVPLVVAIDLVVVLLLTRFVRLEVAVLVTRPVFAVLGVAAIVRARRAGRLAWPEALRMRDLGVVGASMAAAVALSMVLSRSCLYADRAWHIPLVSSFRGQRLPFANVYEPGVQLPYHYAGDVFAAMFQILSLDALHTARALTVAHDVAFGLTGATVALLLLWLGHRRVVVVAGIVLSMLLAGPMAILREEKNSIDSGYNFGSYLRLSYRPHHCLAGLFMVGFAGAVLVRLGSSRSNGRDQAPPPTAPLATAVPLVSVTAAMVLADETSVGLLGLALGALWILVPESLHPKRVGGIAVLAALLAAVALPVLLIGGSFAPDAPRHAVTIVPWRSPGFNHPVVPLSNLRGVRLLAFDLAPMLVATAIGAGVFLRRRARADAAALSFYGSLLVLSTVLLTRIDVDRLPVESHRFMSAAVFLFPLFVGYWLAPVTDDGAWFALPSLAPAAAAVLALGVSSTSSLDWLVHYARGRCTPPSKLGSKHDLLAVRCREQSAGAGEQPRPTYLAKEVWYYHAGCHPLYSAGPPSNHWATKVGAPKFGPAGFDELDHDMVRADEPLALVCPIGRSTTHDPVCAFAHKLGRCHPLGPETSACELSGADRAELRRVLHPANDAPPAGATPPDGAERAKPDPATENPR